MSKSTQIPRAGTPRARRCCCQPPVGEDALFLAGWAVPCPCLGCSTSRGDLVHVPGYRGITELL